MDWEPHGRETSIGALHYSLDSFPQTPRTCCVRALLWEMKPHQHQPVSLSLQSTRGVLPKDPKKFHQEEVEKGHW
jgi:hypothetical protein